MHSTGVSPSMVRMRVPAAKQLMSAEPSWLVLPPVVSAAPLTYCELDVLT